ncbi:hypothetical protein LOAG_01547 [Loa loa]|uniref:Uncharacterized protein n=1 Tax=Loa loa TaxID=7209 RepID=A0A1S0U8Z0_LOALO|nr:hypothetical protein LOAG_01547 [Loa loa]EFO26940.1 hypothetical protein LOAG_01547 [Loa loa]
MAPSSRNVTALNRSRHRGKPLMVMMYRGRLKDPPLLRAESTWWYSSEIKELAQLALLPHVEWSSARHMNTINNDCSLYFTLHKKSTHTTCHTQRYQIYNK